MQTNNLKNVSIPLWGLLIISLLAVLFFAKAIFIPMFLAVLASFVLTPAVRLLEKLHISRTFGSALILVIFFAMIIVAFNLLAQPASKWLDRLPTEIRQIENKVLIFKDTVENVQKTKQRYEEITAINQQGKAAPQVVVKEPSMVYSLLDSTQSFVVGVLSFAALLFFLLAFGDSLERDISNLWSKRSDRAALIGIARDVRTQTSHYLFVVTVINIGLGALVTLAMWAVGMPNPLVWGALATALNFIPYLGPAINLGIVALVALLTFDTAARMLLPPLALLALNIIEGQFVQPIFVGKMFTINPILVFLSVLGWGWLWGMAGVFMAVPLLMTGKILWDRSRESANLLTSEGPTR